MVGNSSSGIMEAASFALPAVNVGMRQQGRERARNVIDAPAETAAILAAITQALSPEFRESLRGMVNPYGDGSAATTIARVLTTVPLDGLLIKQPAPLPHRRRLPHRRCRSPRPTLPRPRSMPSPLCCVRRT
jgi:UDP-N-acetylglucosamine 2-epimerase (non-hydrolysing)/GDP/UDP-N,N'-diacetylbacillosamine 2-epimerase (hydrolysing)